jgi:hypothetical protein
MCLSSVSICRSQVTSVGDTGGRGVALSFCGLFFSFSRFKRLVCRLSIWPLSMVFLVHLSSPRHIQWKIFHSEIGLACTLSYCFIGSTVYYCIILVCICVHRTHLISRPHSRWPRGSLVGLRLDSVRSTSQILCSASLSVPWHRLRCRDITVVGDKRTLQRELLTKSLDYCNAFLTHDSNSVRKQHNLGFKHKANVRSFYKQFFGFPGQQSEGQQSRWYFPDIQCMNSMAGALLTQSSS